MEITAFTATIWDRIKQIKEEAQNDGYRYILDYDLKHDEKTVRQIYNELKFYATYDFYFFTKYIIDVRVNGQNLINRETHYELLKFLLKWKAQADYQQKKLILMPRGTFKTTIITKHYPLWLLITNPDLRILIGQEVHYRAKETLAGIKNIIMWHPLFKLLFGDWSLGLRQDKLKWAEDKCFINLRQNFNITEPTFTTFGTDMANLGGHYDLIILDDIVSWVNTQTEHSLSRIINFYRFALSLLEPTGKIIIVGTPWHTADLYNYLEEEEKLATFKRSAYNEDGTLFFPQRLTEEFLTKQRKAQGSAIFSAQYLCKPISYEDAPFKEDDIQYWDKLPSGLKLYMTCDPAISVNSTSDYSAIIIAGKDNKENIYVLIADRKKLTPLELIKQLINYYKKFQVLKLGIETVAFQKVLKYNLEQEAKKNNLQLDIVELKPDTKVTKGMRIRALQPIVENKQLYIHKTHLFLRDELIQFPRSRYDDLLDALSYMLQLLPKEEEPIDYIKIWQKEAKLLEEIRYQPYDYITGY